MEVDSRPETAMDLDVSAFCFSGGKEINPNLEPASRSRANTWHGRPKLVIKDENSATEGADVDTGPDGEPSPDGDALVIGPEAGGVWRKGTTRRNAWGNLSYADLITKAIESSSEKRMTLSQIYGWMVQNISFFKDKGESNSSAGWKNSIRHNLSLHNRFMRVQNEGTGKSSWWMINPDAKAIKVPRRRAATMDAKTYTSKRGRVQRAISINQVPSSSDSVTKNKEYGAEVLMDPSVFSSQDYRVRSSSNASSMGCMPHMQVVEESDDVNESDFVSSSSSSMPWNGDYTVTENFDETLSESLADIFVGNLSKVEARGSDLLSRPAVQEAVTVYSSTATQCTFVTRDSPLSYPGMSSSSTFGTLNNNSLKSALCNDSHTDCQVSYADLCYRDEGHGMNFGTVSDGILPFRGMVGQSGAGNTSSHLSSHASAFGKETENLEQINSKRLNELLMQGGGPAGNLYNRVLAAGGADLQQLNPTLASSLSGNNRQLPNLQQLPGIGANARQLNSQLLLQLLANKPHLVAKMQQLLQMRQQYQQRQQQQLSSPTALTLPQPIPSIANHSSSVLQQLLVTSCTTDVDSPNTHQPVDLLNDDTSAHASVIPADLDLNFLDVDAADIDCDIDQVIKHELTFGEKLDFSFDQSNDG